MTVDCTNIESILGPARRQPRAGGGTISLRHAFYSEIKWTLTSDPPVSRWIGNYSVATELYSSDEMQRRIRVAAFVAFMKFVPVLAAGHPWCLLDHQTGGVSCQHRRFVGRRLQLKPSVEVKCVEIAQSWYASNLGSRGIPALSELTKYRSQLSELGLNCDGPETFTYLVEGLYPADLEQSVIDRVCQNPFPLEGILAPSKFAPQLELSNARLVFIAPNSD